MEKNIKCECNVSAKKVCCKMQTAGLRSSIQFLAKIKDKDDSTAIKNILYDIYKILGTYQCLPSKCLLYRVQDIRSRIRSSRSVGLHPDEQSYIESLISEANCFIEHIESIENENSDFWENLESLK